MTLKKLEKVKRNKAAQPKIARKGRRVRAALEVQLWKTVAELGLTEARKIFDSIEVLSANESLARRDT